MFSSGLSFLHWYLVGGRGGGKEPLYSNMRGALGDESQRQGQTEWSNCPVVFTFLLTFLCATLGLGLYEGAVYAMCLYEKLLQAGIFYCQHFPVYVRAGFKPWYKISDSRVIDPVGLFHIIIHVSVLIFYGCSI